jgi:hypothetical protein
VSSTETGSNPLPWAPRLVLPIWIAASVVAPGCAVHRVGMIEPQGDGVAVVSPDGKRERLLLLGDADALRHLAEHLVELDGRKGFGAITVLEWRALEGPHGMPVFLGPVQRLGIQIGIADVNSGQLLMVDAAAARELERWIGDRVAAEGYIDGPQQLEVLHWVLLDPPPDGPQLPWEAPAE